MQFKNGQIQLRSPCATTLPPLHKDRMDRMLIVQALLDGLAVITNDCLCPSYDVPAIW